MKILTTYPIPESPRWKNQTTLLEHNSDVGMLSRIRGLRHISLALKMFRLRRQYDVLISGAMPSDCLFALLQTLIPGPKTPHIMTCCVWNRGENRITYWLRRGLLWLAARSIDTFVVWSTEERQNHAEYLGVPTDRFVFIPHHATLESFNVQPVKGDYVFAGGDSLRDYDTLLEAVADLDIPLVIAAKNPRWREAARELPHVQVDAVSEERYVELMAGSRLVVVPLEEGTCRGAGQQTYLNAMQLRKPVIVSESPGVHDHLEDGKTAWVVPAANSIALRDAIEQIWADDRELLNVIDAAELAVAENFTLEHFVERNLEVAERLVEQLQGSFNHTSERSH